jgi:hypothetical protein
MHNEKLYHFYSSSSIIRLVKSRSIKWPGHVARMRRAHVYMLLVGKPEEKSQRRRFVANIRMDFTEVGQGRIDLAQDRDWWKALVHTAMNLRVP